MSTAKQYREERAGLVSRLNEMASLVSSEGRSFSAEETAEFNNIDQAQKDLLSKAETLEKIESIPKIEQIGKEDRKYSVGPQISKEDVNLAFAAWAGGNKLKMTEKHYRACEKLGVNAGCDSFELKYNADANTYAQTITTSGGGYTIQAAAMQPLEVALKRYGSVRRHADVIRTSTGADLPFPTCNDTSNKGAILAINTQVAEQALAFGTVSLGAFKFTSKQVLVPLELMQDTAINLPEFIGSRLGERIGRIQEEYFTTGDGTGKPLGFLNSTTAGKTATDDATFTWLEVQDLISSVDPDYRANAKIMVHDAVWSYMKKMVDGENRPLWLASNNLSAGAPDTFLGYPVVVNQEMPSVLEASAKVMAFGDFTNYKIRDVMDIEVIRMNERYADYHQVAFVAVGRSDGRLVAPTSAAPIKHLALAAS